MERRLSSARQEPDRFETIPVTREIAERSSKLQADLRAEGSQLGINEVYIAATATHYALPLVTRNIKHFKRVTELKLENY